MEKEIAYHKPYVIAGLILVLVMILSLAIYTFGEQARLTKAAEYFTEERVSRGLVVYQQQCAACHGMEGEGGAGPALQDRTLLKNTLDSVFFAVVRSGVPGTQMPAWSVDFGGPLTDEDVRDVVAYMRSWEPEAPEIETEEFIPDPARGSAQFSSTCSICHGENGMGGTAPRLNDPARLAELPDNWYRDVIRNGRPAKGMPTWGTVLSPEQIEDLVALVAAWRQGERVSPVFSVTDLLDSAIFSLQNDDEGSAALQIERALMVAQGVGAEVLRTAQDQLDSGDPAGAQATLADLREQWPLGDPTIGAQLYTVNCSACHGFQGEGGIGAQLRPNEFIQSQSNGQLVAFIQEGRLGTSMAGFLERLSEIEIAHLVAFLRLWQQ